MKTFTYSTPTKTIDYEVEPQLVRRALAEIVFNREFDCFMDKCVLGLSNNPKVVKGLIIASLMNFISGYDLETKLEKDMHEDLKDYFEEYAFKSQED